MSIASGLEWQNIGPSRPPEGRELTASDPDLAKALTSKLMLTQEEWDAIGIRDLRKDDFIKSGDSYFKPVHKGISLPHGSAEGVLGLKWKEVANPKTGGAKIENEKLAAALKGKVEFQREECDRRLSNERGEQMERCLKDLADAVRSEDFERAKQLKARRELLKNEDLGAAPKSKVEFKREEWESFEVSGLSSDSYF